METTIIKENLVLPSLTLNEWKETKDTLHLFLQVIGKIRLSFYLLRVYKWWHASLYISSRGIITGKIPYQNGIFEIELDLINHLLVIHTASKEKIFSLYDGLTVAEFYNKIILNLSDIGIKVNIDTSPYRHLGAVHFIKNAINKYYDKEFIERFFNILKFVDGVFEEFRCKYSTKSAQVLLFWDSFDLAIRNFSGKIVQLNEAGNTVNNEAYSNRVIRFGFWGGDDDIQEPAFYSCTYPAAKNLTEESLMPNSPYWRLHSDAIVLLMYEEFRSSDFPKELILDFLESSYHTGAGRNL